MATRCAGVGFLHSLFDARRSAANIGDEKQYRAGLESF